jgi:hypothetical protein
MDRIVVKAQSNRDENSFFQSLISIFVGAAAILIAAAAKQTSSSRSSASANHVQLPIIIDLSVLACIVYFLSKAWRRNQRKFKEAAIEITPFGVQLVSIFGTCSDALALFNSTGAKDEEVKIRAFIPTQQIIDVIVMEMVWPHCVWSQLAFRVVQKSARLSSKLAKEQQICEKPTLQHNASKVHELLQDDRVSIVPCFPDECRGLLTYKQCLDVQVEIERLLYLSSTVYRR